MCQTMISQIFVSNIRSLQGRTPLRIALLEGSLDIAGLLLDNAADIDYVDTDCRFYLICDLTGNIWTEDQTSGIREDFMNIVMLH